VKIDDYFISIERGLSQNPQISKIEEPNDNAPHHPEIATHPHHKHIGPKDRLAPADQPNLSQVLTEINELLGHQTK
jgi:hypothetical protein